MDPIKECIEYKREVNETWDFLDDLVVTGKITKESLAKGLTKIRESTLNFSLRIQRYFSNLDESELLNYIEAGEDEYQLGSLGTAKKLDAITDLFTYIDQPSDILIQAHNRHIKRIESL